MRFLIVSPRYSHKSEGVVVLHQMARDLQSLGYETSLIWLGANNIRFDTFLLNHNARTSGVLYGDIVLETFDEYNREEDIVIYPEIVPGNPLAAKRVIRFFLNRECFLFKDNHINPGPSDFILSYHPEYVDKPDFILLKPTFDLGKIEFISAGTRHLNSFYIGKAVVDIEAPHIEGAINIGKIDEKPEYERLLTESKYMLTYDPLTSVIRDAILFGAIPVILNHRPWSAEKISKLNENIPMIDLCTGRNLHFISNERDFWLHRERYVTYIRGLHAVYKNDLIHFTKAVKQHFTLGI